MISRGLATSIPMAGTELTRRVASEKYTKGFLDIRKLFPKIRAWIDYQRTTRSSPKRLHVAETVSLGEKRFVAVVHVDGLQFLIGGSAASMSLLAQLNTKQTFCESIEKAIDSAAPVLKSKRKPAAKRPSDEVWGNA